MFIEVKCQKDEGYENMTIALNQIKGFVKDRDLEGDQVIMVTVKGQDDKIVSGDLSDYIRALHKYGFSEKTELVGRNACTQLIKDNGAPYEATINVNLVTSFYSHWEGRMTFSDGTWMESAFSMHGMLHSMNIKPITIQSEEVN